ncbi:D-tagatose-bisphosphate aldolase, class II, non-catalytic subunit [Marinomonas rhizomae]|uniref:Tagatose-bisphosphate aldolase noncatalytic subunit n=1 Tax=Marinomonas rhizomae TaxID=491948 RepID=A0A366JB43_9GAMM|nr:D-tagatose-bisphosphate aldolase, class II, non-catalytic subunit [Marinomonas rhizomae]RBP83494.1 tagatose-bisphosphate aldolase noncatalytic subunit [Marinomonas rhizomae]RNF74045.1 D-tagatose-bisphosphate aldolase, class II, non-catalytic subunit [Marinomonas rhizomae]
MSSTEILKNIVKRNRSGEQVGIYSVCSANRFVLEAAMLEAKENNSPLLIEATCNQVNQDGGYTNMTPADFQAYISEVAKSVDYDTNQLILGGDHLGPNPWKHLSSADAMEKAMALVEAYVKAGFTKIHLDASMSCADDEVPLSSETIAKRAAIMCQAAERVSLSQQKPYYIIGTEVPVPGGAQEDLEELQVTSTIDLADTIHTHRVLFSNLDIDDAFDRVIGVVVQPGVEFDHSSVIEYNPVKAKELKSVIHQFSGMVFEAHSTDYQSQSCLSHLVRDHFAILKVGPGLTFAFREAVFALSYIEDEWIEPEKRSNIREVLEQTMVNNPKYWEGYYHGNEQDKMFARKFSFSDRSRYYWNHADIEASLKVLIQNLTVSPAPYPLISQYMSAQYIALRKGEIMNDPAVFLRERIRSEIKMYAQACNQFSVS